MKIKINQSLREPWGRLNIDDTRTASKTLSGDAFKVWVELALNQNGYIYQDMIDCDILQELVTSGYISSTGADSFLFDAGGGAKDVTIPESWLRVAEMYGVNGIADYQYILNKLNSVSLDDKFDDILAYWAASFKKLSQNDRNNIKNPLRYDFSIVLVWWTRDYFRFKIGDVIIAGYSGERLKYHNDQTKNEVCRSLVAHHTDRFVIHENNKPYWDNSISKGLIELKLEDIGEILRERKAHDEPTISPEEKDGAEAMDPPDEKTFVSGDGFPGRRIRDLTEEEANEIKEKIRRGVRYQVIEEEYGMRSGTITANFVDHWGQYLVAKVNGRV